MAALRIAAVLALLISSCLSSVTRGEDPGQADLDKAISVKVKAESIDQLGQVIELCQSALDRGLDKDNTLFAKKLMAATLLQRATIVHEALTRANPQDNEGLQQFVQLRQIALSDLERAIRHDPTQPEAHYLIGRLHALPGGDRKRAMTALDEALKLKVEDNELRARALITRAALQTDPALRLADCDAAVKAAPENAEVWRARGTLQLEQGHIKEALADIEAALKLDPKHASTLELHGVTLASLGRYDEGLASLAKAIELNPESPFPYVHRARIQMLRDKPQDAIADLNKALDSELPNPAVLLLRAGAYQQLGDNEKALADIDEVLKLRPGLVQALRARAALLAGSGKFDKAILDLQEIRKADTKDPRVLTQLGILFGANKQIKEAIDAFTSAIEIEPGNLLAHQNRADTYLRIAKHAEAIADYEVVLKAEPKNSHVLNNLAWTLATSPDGKLRDGKRAIELATEACKITDFKQPHLLSTLAAGYAEIADFKTAIEWSKKAVEMSEDDLKENLAKELRSYEAGKPWRESQNELESPEDAKSTEKTAQKPGESREQP